jgi:hypothetical protein
MCIENLCRLGTAKLNSKPQRGAWGGGLSQSLLISGQNLAGVFWRGLMAARTT